MSNREPHNPRTPLQLQITYLLQALVVILVTGLTVLLFSTVLPFSIEGRYFQSSEIYFLAVIANLVFFHTLAWHIVEESRTRVVLGTAVTTLVTSVLMYGVYYLYATFGL
jgi:riboflavin transporter FmnP